MLCRNSESGIGRPVTRGFTLLYKEMRETEMDRRLAVATERKPLCDFRDIAGRAIVVEHVGMLSSRLTTPSTATRRFLCFSAVGFAGAVVNTVALSLLHGALHWPVAVASALATEIAIVHNYLLNDRLTFASDGVTARRFLRYNLVALAGLAVTVATVTLLTAHTALPVIVANGAGMALAVAWNFAASVRWAWAPDGERRETPRLASAASAL